MAEIRDAIAIVVRGFRFGDPGLEEELVQDAVGRVFLSVNAGRFRGESSLKTYAQNVAKYTCLEHRRRKRPEVALDPESLPETAILPGPEESLLHSEEHRRNLKAFASLPRECRELFLLIFLQGMSYREVGARLGVTEGAIKSRVHRLRRLCRRLTRTGSTRAPLRRPATGRAIE